MKNLKHTPKKTGKVRGQDTLSCKLCNRKKGIIRKYKLNICRQCFRENAEDLGFIKI